MLAPGLRMKVCALLSLSSHCSFDAWNLQDLTLGRWTLSETEVQLVDLVDVSGNYRLPSGFSLPETSTSFHPHHEKSDKAGLQDLRYAFTMTLSLKSKPVIGRWNRLDLMSYESVNLESGDSVPIWLGKEKPFWFSRVKSYA